MAYIVREEMQTYGCQDKIREIRIGLVTALLHELRHIAAASPFWYGPSIRHDEHDAEQ